MTSHWVVVADASSARFLAGDETLDTLKLVEQLDHPDGRRKASDLVSDERGHTRAPPGRNHALDPMTSPHRAALQAFARAVADRIALGRARNAFERLIVVAPPQFLGELRPRLGAMNGALVATIAKDWTKASIHELPGRVKRALPETAGLPETTR